MRTTRLMSWVNIKPWLTGALLSTVAMLLGYELGSEAARRLGGEPGIWARLAKGFLWGAVLAGLQWPIVRAAGVLPVRFLVASAVGLAVGYPLGQTIQGIFVHNWGLHWTGYWLGVATFGLSLGVPQWWIFRRHLKRANLWVLFSVAGWMLTGLMWLSGARAGFEYGIVTGLGLVWLVRSRPPDFKNAGA